VFKKNGCEVSNLSEGVFYSRSWGLWNRTK